MYPYITKCMSKFKLTQLLVVMFSISSIYAQQSTQKESPKLVVTITIDQLRSDYLQFFLDGFGEKGFRRLVQNGLVYNDVRFEFPKVDKSTVTATVFTGTNPFYHGIISDKIYDVKQKKVLPSLHDPGFMGNYTSETLSPKNLLTSTIGDELKIATFGMSEVFAVAPDYEVALLSAGHAADAAYWLDDLNGHWATTTYFKDLPWYIDRYNTQESLASRIENLSWKNLHQPSYYHFFPFIQNSNSGFSYQYTSYDRFRAIKSTPLVNEEVTRLAEQFFEYSTIGRKNVPDLLALSYFAGIREDKSIKEYAAELQDTYFRLDKELEKLLDLIDKKVGLKNTLVVVVSTGYFNSKEDIPERLKIDSGEFYPKRSLALLNMYLMAIYGQGNWIEKYYDKQLFFNKKLIEDKQLSLEDIQRKSADFLLELSGVQNVVTSYDLYHALVSNDLAQTRNGYRRGLSGDLLLEIQSGWKIIEEDESVNVEYNYKSHIPSPLIILAPNIQGKTIQQKIRATQIAPSICHILRIRPPNAASDDILEEVK